MIGSEAGIPRAGDWRAPSGAGGNQMPAARIAWQAPNGACGVITLGQDSGPGGERLPASAGAGRTSLAKAGEGEFSVTVTFAGNGPAQPATSPFDSRVAELYLDLMKKCLTRMVFQESGPPLNPEHDAFDPAVREMGGDWPADAETMVGLRRLDNVQDCVVDVLRRGVPGDLIETGVWRGGTTIFMRAILEAYCDRHRQVWVADSFEGLPRPNVEQYPADAGLDLWEVPVLAVSRDEVKTNFARYGLLDERVRFLKGWFKDTLPQAPIRQLAVMRLDGDLYESTMDGLTALYPKLSVGGYVILDDYNNIPASRQAVDDFRNEHGITEPIHSIDRHGAYWRREA